MNKNVNTELARSAKECHPCNLSGTRSNSHEKEFFFLFRNGRIARLRRFISRSDCNEMQAFQENFQLQGMGVFRLILHVKRFKRHA